MEFACSIVMAFFFSWKSGWCLHRSGYCIVAVSRRWNVESWELSVLVVTVGLPAQARWLRCQAPLAVLIPDTFHRIWTPGLELKRGGERGREREGGKN